MNAVDRSVLRKLATAGRLTITDKDPRVATISPNEVALYEVIRLRREGYVQIISADTPHGQRSAVITRQGRDYLNQLEVAS